MERIMNEYVVPEDKLEELAKRMADTIERDLMDGGPTSPPGKTLRKDIIFDSFIKEQEEKKNTETLKILLELKKEKGE